MIGINKGEVKLVAHSTDWSTIFNEEKKLLHSLIGEHIQDIQHIGSTAINGIAAKPLIDIVVGVQTMADVEQFDTEKLKAIGYYHLHRVKLDKKEVFAKFSNLETLTKTHILHIVEYQDEWWNQHIFFRDFLNRHPEVAKEYETLKKTLAFKYPNNERAYTDEKKAFVDDVLNNMEK
ncbi:GrpB family protein [Alkalihalobacillus sp. 1P02AB]|uniref:GrpB family protein n=1 Tax=Alkalihalobacillus sp. 1P02AB TaxID=3132260 RepID=UPI0039A40256